MKPSRFLPAMALGLLLAATASAQHHVGGDKADYDPTPGGGDPNTPAHCEGVAAVVRVNGSSTAFSPSSITIDAGQPVCWTWEGTTFQHNIKADDGSFSSGQPDINVTFQRTFNDPGSYGYYCQVHGSATGGMRGVVIVNDPGGEPIGSGPGTLSIEPAAYTADEAGGPLTLTVTRTGGADGKVTVKIATGTGSATKGKDFLPKTAVLTWLDGDQNPKSFTVTIKNDTLIEGNETFAVTLTKPTGGSVIGNGSGTVTIDDDEGCPETAATPAALKATGASADEIRLSWAARGAAGDQVRIERGRAEEAFREIAVVPASAGGFVDSGLPAATTFQYRVRGEGRDGVADYSEIAVAATDGAIGACAGGPHALCLGDGRFEVSASFRPSAGERPRAAQRAATGEPSSTGLFSLGGEDLALMVEVRDGCATNDHFWVSLAALTDAELDVAVRDTQTGRTWVFHNPAGKAAEAVRDVDAFGTCP